MSDKVSTIQTDVVIVGAGPAGLATAIRLGQLGVRRFVIVDRQNFPRDKTCGSAVTPGGIRTLKKLGVYAAVVPHAHWIRGLRFDLPRRRKVRAVSDVPLMLVCLRRVFDQILLERALEVGAQFVSNFHADYLLQRGDRVFGVRSTDGREIHARQTVVADGVHSKFAPARPGRRLIHTIMGWWETAPAPHDELEFVYDRALRPFYGWRFPESPTRVNIGIGYEDPAGRIDARELFKEFLQRHYEHFLGTARQIGAFKGQPLSPSVKTKNLTSPGRIVVGEAGRLVDPATGEGISQALYSGTLAAETLHDIINANGDDREALGKYEAACRKKFDRLFRYSGIIREFINHGGIEALSHVLPEDYRMEWTEPPATVPA